MVLDNFVRMLLRFVARAQNPSQPVKLIRSASTRLRPTPRTQGTTAMPSGNKSSPDRSEPTIAIDFGSVSEEATFSIDLGLAGPEPGGPVIPLDLATLAVLVQAARGSAKAPADGEPAP